MKSISKVKSNFINNEKIRKRKCRFKYNKKHYIKINATNTVLLNIGVYINRTYTWRQINIRKIFPEVINVSSGKRLFSLTLILTVSQD